MPAAKKLPIMYQIEKRADLHIESNVPRRVATIGAQHWTSYGAAANSVDRK